MISDELLLKSTPAELVELFEYTFDQMRQRFDEQPELVDWLLEPVKKELEERAARGRKPLEGGERQALR